MRSLALFAVASLILVACADAEGPTDVSSPGSTSTASAPASPPADASPSPPRSSPAEEVRLGLQTVADGLEQPLVATAPAGDDDRLFIAERPGTVRIVRDGTLVDEPFLDISDRTRTGGEFGLLGLAFHPGYPDDPRFFVHHSAVADGSTRIVEYRVSDDPDRADPGSARVLLTVAQPASNHNGGTIAFGPDGNLFIGLGDGGGGGDTFGNGQDPSNLLGALLRIDVDGTTGDRAYGIPDDNPFADGEDGAPEVWAYGLRNPYRFSFDDGLIYIADVGQSDREELNVAPADTPGLNYGWPITEGTVCFRSPDCDRSGLTAPVLDYPHQGDVCGIIGGHVYRGPNEAFAGTYLYGDLCAGWVRSLRYADGQVLDERDRTDELGLGNAGGGYFLLSFGQDAAGEVYVLTASAVHRVVVR